MPVVSPSGVGRLTWLRNLTRNRKALLGFCIVIFFVLVADFRAPDCPRRSNVLC